MSNLGEVAKVFFKLGLFAFGGPAAHIAMMEDEIVTKRKWMTHSHFLDLVGATNLIPGPNSTEMTMHCGYHRAGIIGLFIAGATFILPAVSLTLACAWLYVKYGNLPQVAPFVQGITPAVIAIITAAVLKLGKKALKNWELAIIACLVVLLNLLGLSEILVLLIAGFGGLFYFSLKNKNGAPSIALSPLLLIASVIPKVNFVLSNEHLFLKFLKIGSVLYGSGYVLFAYLNGEFVNTGWLTQNELMEAIAVGQFTPGPVLSTATFVGFQLGGFTGAILATIGIFLPSFLFVWLLNPLITKLRSSKFLRFFLDSVNVGALGIMVAVLLTMTASALSNWQSAVIMIIGFVMTFAIKKSSTILTVVTSAIAGHLLHLI